MGLHGVGWGMAVVLCGRDVFPPLKSKTQKKEGARPDALLHHVMRHKQGVHVTYLGNSRASCFLDPAAPSTPANLVCSMYASAMYRTFWSERRCYYSSFLLLFFYGFLLNGV